MNICPISYRPCGTAPYAREGLHRLAPGLTDLKSFPYSAKKQREEAALRADKISIQGVQPKLSVRLDRKDKIFRIVDTGGRYIIKPQHAVFSELPENEDVTMKMAAAAGLEVPFHGMVRSADGTFSYFIRRFDRAGRTGKYAVEDFAQLSGRTRDTKYNSSMERVAGVIEKYCTFPLPEKLKLFRMSLFAFLTGNEDMHLKNFSVITRENKVGLSPCYDLLNTSIALRNAKEQYALPLKGRKNNLTRKLLVAYFGKERLGLPDRAVDEVVDTFRSAFPAWERLLEICFLSAEMKEAYLVILRQRRTVLDI